MGAALAVFIGVFSDFGASGGCVWKIMCNFAHLNQMER